MSKEPELFIVKVLIALWDAGGHYIGLVLFAIIGGLVDYIEGLIRGDIKFKIASLIGKGAISGFAGLLAALLATSMDFSIEMVYFCAGLSGHLGTSGISLMQHVLMKKFKINIDKK